MQSQSQNQLHRKRTQLWSSDKEKELQIKFLFGMMSARKADLATALTIVRSEDFDYHLRPVFDVLYERLSEGKDVSWEAMLSEEPKQVLIGVFSSKAEVLHYVSEGYLSAQLPEKSLLVREAAIRRNLIQTMQNRIMELEAGLDVFDTMSCIEREVADMYPTDVRGGLVDVGTLLYKEIERALMPQDEKESGYIRTGFRSIDALTFGFMPGEFIFIGARPGMGKTGFGISLSINLAKGNVPHVFFSVEMTKEQIVRRYLSQVTGIPVTDLAYNQISVAGQELFEAKNKSFIKLNSMLSLDDSSGATTEYIRQRVKQLIAEKGIKFVIVDYLQKMTPLGKHGNREQEISQISGGLARIAKDCNIPVLAFGQLNREVERRTDKRPTLSDIRDSGSVEQDAHRVGFLYRPEKYEIETTDDGISTAGLAELDWQKTRDGATGVCRLRFDDQLTRFGDYVHSF